MKKVFYLLLLTFIGTGAYSQDVAIDKGWKFKTGDDSANWKLAAFSDADWKSIEAGKNWESQGYEGYDGFAWYRLHFVMPSSIKEKAYLKEKLRINLGNVLSGDEVYLNGKLIGKNANRPGDIRSGGRRGGPRSYTIDLNDNAILWDKDNVLVVRVYNTSGPGGLAGGNYGISIIDLNDFVTVNTDSSFHIGSRLTKEIGLTSTLDNYDYTGKLNIVFTDPDTKKNVYTQSVNAAFSKTKPFSYTLSTSVPEVKAYEVSYTFIEDRTKKQLTKTEGTPYLLTPKVSAKPRINSPDVFGARPGNPFMYKIPATGEKPLQYSVNKLPGGLKVDAATGIITGVATTKGSYPVKLVVKNKLATVEKDFTIEIGDQIGLTPALGWNSWNAWGTSVSDEKVRISAKAMADHLIDHGWTYINLDDGWESPKRAADSSIVPNEKFPDMKGLSDYVHGLGLKIGIYSSPGPTTCGRYLGSWRHEQQDATTFGNWGIDYLKYDWCSYTSVSPANPGNRDIDLLKKPYQVMRASLDNVKRDILYSLCQYGWGEVWKWGNDVGGDSWRTTGDITDTWESLSRIGFIQDKSSPYAKPSGFNDMDMMIVGKVGWGPRLHNSRLSPDEQYTHLSLWSLLASPLLIGCDMGQLDDFTLNLLTNDEVIAINQDPLGKQAFKLSDKDSVQVWVKELKNGEKAVGIFNLSSAPQKPVVNFADIKLDNAVKLRDVWRQKDLGRFTGSYSATIPAHGVVFVRVSK